MSADETKDAPEHGFTPSCWTPLFSLWILGWLAVAVAGAGMWICWEIHLEDGDEVIVDDWTAKGSDSDGYWPDQYFGDHTADRLRRVTTYRGKTAEVLTIQFFASIPMNYPEFDLQLRQWRTLPEFREVGRDSYPPLRSEHHPDWFPTRNYVGSLVKPWKTYHLFRSPGDDHLYVE